MVQGVKRAVKNFEKSNYLKVVQIKRLQFLQFLETYNLESNFKDLELKD